MKQNYYLPGICLAVFGLMASGCSKDDDAVPGGGWPDMDWRVEQTVGNITVDQHNIIVASPGGSVEMVCRNYSWVTLLPYEGVNIKDGMTDEEISYARTHLSDEYVRISTDGNRMYCEIFDVPADFTGELYRFTATVGDRFENFYIRIND